MHVPTRGYNDTAIYNSAMKEEQSSSVTVFLYV